MIVLIIAQIIKRTAKKNGFALNLDWPVITIIIKIISMAIKLTIGIERTNLFPKKIPIPDVAKNK